MVFSGNPGTGKTTVGRLITDIFYNLGYINQKKLTEVTAKDLIAEYLGQTSGKTYNVVKSAVRRSLIHRRSICYNFRKRRPVDNLEESALLHYLNLWKIIGIS